MKRSVAESLPGRTSVHTSNASFKVVSAPEQYCSAPLVKVERSLSDRYLKLFDSSLNIIGAKIATEPRIDKWSFQVKKKALYDRKSDPRDHTNWSTDYMPYETYCVIVPRTVLIKYKHL